MKFKPILLLTGRWRNEVTTRSCHQYNYVPNHKAVNDEDVERLQNFVSSSSRMLILSGAGISTESGIPDYRSETVGLYARSGHKPVQFQDFLRSESIRRRYWARNFLGWPRFSSVEPNVAHLCLTQWEKSGKIYYCVTQNVDRLHHKAGTQRIIELHGSGYWIKCMSCKYSVSRFLFQQTLEQLNKHLATNELQDMSIRPDGDVDITSQYVQLFQFPSCPRCQGILKPDIVFFGENVPKQRVDSVYEKLSECDSLLIIGSSLYVYSGFRFALAAAEQNKPIALINIGATRIDNFEKLLRLNTRAGEILPHINV